MIERARNFAGNTERFVERELSLAVETRAERLTGDERHDVIQLAIRLTRIVDRKDMRMAQMRREIYLTPESLRAESEANVGEQHFDRDLSIVFEVARKIYGGHGAVTELTLDLVTCSYSSL